MSKNKKDKFQSGYRHARLEQIIFEEISLILRDDVNNIILNNLLVLRVELSGDLKNVKIYFKINDNVLSDALGDNKIKQALDKSCSYLRYKLAEVLDLKRVPNLSLYLQV